MGFHEDYRKLLMDLKFNNTERKQDSAIPQHPIGMTAKDQFDAVGKSMVLFPCVQSCLLRHVHVRSEPQRLAAV